MSARERIRERRRRRARSGDRGRAIYLLPNLITSASLLLGFWSIVMSIDQRFERAALFIVLAGICDIFDGYVARATRSTSPFGVEYDSITDMVSFGIAPALLVYNWVLAPLGHRAWLIGALFALCAALRLARFNVHVNESDRYHGIPSTAAGAFVAATVWFTGWLGLTPPFSPVLSLVLTIGFAALAVLMVSAVPYPSWKMVQITRRHPFTTLVAVVLGLVAILLHHEPMLFAIGLLFIASGPALWWIGRRRAPQVIAAEPTESTELPTKGPPREPTGHVG